MVTPFRIDEGTIEITISLEQEKKGLNYKLICMRYGAKLPETRVKY